ncbi:MAG: hypothetical protein Kow0031_19390 [Anaerolineae bacterium]
MAHAIIYDRASTILQKDNFSRVNAREVGIRIAEQHGYTWEYVKEIGSGTTLTGRPEMMKILDRIEAGEVQALIVQELDRLARPEESVVYSTIRTTVMNYNVLIYTHSSLIDLNNDDDDFVADITMSVAKKERRRILKRMMRGRVARAESGKFVGNPGLGYRFVGYKHEADLEIDPEEKQAVKLIFETLLENGGNLRATAAYMNKLGYTTIYGNKFRSNTIKYIATRKIYIGVFENKLTDKITHRPDLQIIDVAQFKQVQNLINRRAGKAKDMGRRGRYIFTGFVVCGNCGGPMVAAKGDSVMYHCHNQRKYGKSACSRSRAYSEHLILPPIVDCMAGLMYDHLNTLDAAITVAAAKQGKTAVEQAYEASVTGELASVQAGKDRLVKGLSLGALSLEEVAAEMKFLRKREQELKVEIAKIAEKTARLEDWQHILEGATGKDRAGIVTHLLQMAERRPMAFRQVLSIVFEPNSLWVRTERAGKNFVGVLEDYTTTDIFIRQNEGETISIDQIMI